MCGESGAGINDSSMYGTDAGTAEATNISAGALARMLNGAGIAGISGNSGISSECDLSSKLLLDVLGVDSEGDATKVLLDVLVVEPVCGCGSLLVDDSLNRRTLESVLLLAWALKG